MNGCNWHQDDRPWVISALSYRAPDTKAIGALTVDDGITRDGRMMRMPYA